MKTPDTTKVRSAFVHVQGVAKKSDHKPGPHIRLVTFNVHFGKNTSAIVKALKENKNLSSADVILMQEIESYRSEKIPRAQSIADKLGMHYVYAPARSIKNNHDTHGLATLSRFPILDVEIIPLPQYRLAWHSRDRIALKVRIDIGGTHIKIINVHLDTLINANERLDQLKPAIDRALLDPKEISVIAGDFNTLPAYFIKRLIPAFLHNQRKVVDSFFLKHGFKTQIEEAEYTMRRGYIRFKLDSIYIRGAKAIKYGTEKDVMVSDHQPVWVDIALS
jgi:endonuclease/exonuclease/phosphatase family metal-dependent hydrolase